MQQRGRPGLMAVTCPKKTQSNDMNIQNHTFVEQPCQRSFDATRPTSACSQPIEFHISQTAQKIMLVDDRVEDKTVWCHDGKKKMIGHVVRVVMKLCARRSLVVYHIWHYTVKTREDEAWVAMMSGVTKRSRLPGTASATRGLGKTRGLRGGPLAGALHSMPAEASSAVVVEKKGTVWCACRATELPCVVTKADAQPHW